MRALSGAPMVERLCTWLDDHPEAVGQRPMPAHVATCTTCREGLERLEARLRHSLAAQEEPVPQRVRARILDAVTERHERRPRARDWPAIVPIAALAAVAVFSISRGSRTSSAESKVAERTPSAIDENAEIETAPTDDAGIERKTQPAGAVVPAGLRALQSPAYATNGRLPSEVIQRVVRQHNRTLRHCYENGRRINPKLSGRIVVKFIIDRSGSVTTAEDGGSDLPDEGVIGCVVQAFGNLTFPQPEGGPVSVVYPIVFTPGE